MQSTFVNRTLNERTLFSSSFVLIHNATLKLERRVNYLILLYNDSQFLTVVNSSKTSTIFTPHCSVISYRERKCADTIGTVAVPRAGHFQC